MGLVRESLRRDDDLDDGRVLGYSVSVMLQRLETTMRLSSYPLPQGPPATTWYPVDLSAAIVPRSRHCLLVLNVGWLLWLACDTGGQRWSIVTRCVCLVANSRGPPVWWFVAKGPVGRHAGGHSDCRPSCVVGGL